MIQQKLTEIWERIARAAQKSHRDPKEIRLIAVAKGQPALKLREALEAGHRDFGENYAQEMLEHLSLIANVGRSPNIHFIGHLQRNKVRQILSKAALIHSIDSLELAREVDRRAAKIGKRQPILIEVNLEGEETKSGIGEKEVAGLVGSLNSLEHLVLDGLMVLPPMETDPEKGRPYFRRLREIRDEINKKNLYKTPLKELSMGMTHDFEVAIEEGSTMVRIGTGIFGERK